MNQGSFRHSCMTKVAQLHKSLNSLISFHLIPYHPVPRCLSTYWGCWAVVIQEYSSRLVVLPYVNPTHMSHLWLWSLHLSFWWGKWSIWMLNRKCKSDKMEGGKTWKFCNLCLRFTNLLEEKKGVQEELTKTIKICMHVF